MRDFEALLGSVVLLDDELAAMQVAGEVRNIDSTLEDIVSFVAGREEFWFHGEPRPTAFKMYHSWRNLRLIFSKMRIRFANAHLVSDNPLVVDQAREIIPRILRILTSLVALEREPSDSDTDLALRRIQELRTSARQVDMTPPASEELREVDQESLTKALDELLNRMATLGES